SAVVTGGTQPYSYVWSNGELFSGIWHLAEGVYAVTVTDNNGCSATSSTTIVDPPSIVVQTTNVVQPNCANQGGSITVSSSGGTGAHTYLWSNGATSATIANLAGGQYTVTVTDTHNCSTTLAVTLTASIPPIATITDVDILCNGANTGSATVNITGGLAPFTYLWSNNATSATISNLTAGTYSVTITDSNHCTATSSTVITQPNSGITLYIQTKQEVSCTGANDGQLTAQAFSSTSEIVSYLWSNGQTSQTAINLAPGLYSVTVTDSNGCTKSVSISLNIRNISIGDYVWIDTNRDGIQQTSEPGLNNVLVKLFTIGNDNIPYTSDDVQIASQNTSNGGHYLFSNLCNGAYYVMFNKPDGYIFTSSNVGNDSLDSDINNILTGNSHVVTITNTSTTNLTIDAGLYVSCDNVINGGTIGSNQTICSGTIPQTIGNITLPTGGSGTIEYLWLQTTVSGEFYSGNPNWIPVPNSNSASYSPGILTQNTWFIRCSRRADCIDYTGETNIVMITVQNCPNYNVIITDFTATTRNQNTVDLNWKTDNELYLNNRFVIERSFDNNIFTPISLIDARGTTTNEFNYVDLSPKIGFNYYRIRHIAIDGNNTQSEIRSAILQRSDNVQMQIYPNPTTDIVNVEIFAKSDKKITLELVDPYGKILKSTELPSGDNVTHLDVSLLPSGIYFITVKYDGFKLTSQKLIKTTAY
nr:T9SS type A sorting domain-containing protein [Saprospiraceae bacterium]